MITVDEKNVATTKDMNAVNETANTSKANAQADTVNAKKDAANEVIGSALKNIVPGWVKDLISNPLVPAVAIGLLTASPVAALGTFGVGTLSKTLAKINENTSGKATYKDATISDKSIILNKDGTWAYTGEKNVKTSSNLPCTTCFGPGKTNTTFDKGGALFEPKGPMIREPQAPPILDDAKEKKESKKEESKQVDSKKEETKKVEPKNEAPKKEEPKKEETKKVEPKKEEPKKEEPKVEVVAEKTVTIPQPMGAVEPKVPETQPTVEIPAPMNNGPAGPAETVQPSSGDVAVVKPRVIHVGESDKDVDKEVQGNEGKSEKTHESDPSVGIWEGRDDIDKNDTKDNSGGDYSSNSDNKSISPEYQALLDSLDSTPDVSDGPDF